jgi:hypothetical protein
MEKMEDLRAAATKSKSIFPATPNSYRFIFSLGFVRDWEMTHVVG